MKFLQLSEITVDSTVRRQLRWETKDAIIVDQIFKTLIGDDRCMPVISYYL
jgi:DNA gyrase/topoisomerase IV subunit B